MEIVYHDLKVRNKKNKILTELIEIVKEVANDSEDLTLPAIEVYSLEGKHAFLFKLTTEFGGSPTNRAVVFQIKTRMNGSLVIYTVSDYKKDTNYKNKDLLKKNLKEQLEEYK